MINLFYSEAYWGYSPTMNGPKKVINNLIESLQEENIEYCIDEEKYKFNFLVQYDYAGHQKHSNLELENCVIGPQIWFFDQQRWDFPVDQAVASVPSELIQKNLQRVVASSSDVVSRIRHHYRRDFDLIASVPFS